MQTEQNGQQVHGKRLLTWLSKTTVFWLYFTLSAVILALAAFTQLVSSARYTRVLTENYMKQTESSFYEHCDAFAESVMGTYGVPTVVAESVDYANLQRIASGQLPKTAGVLALNGIRSSFSTLLGGPPKVACTESFLYLPFADALCTASRIFSQAEQCFEDYLLYEGISAAELKQRLQTEQMISYIPGTKVSVGGKEPATCVTFLFRSSRDGIVMGLVFREEDLHTALRFSELPADSYLNIAAAGDRTIYSCGEAVKGESYHVLTRSLHGVGWTATVGVPHAYFDELTRPTHTFAVLLLAVTMFVGLALSFLFSTVGSRPLRRMLSAYAAGDETSEQRNELMRLAELLASSHLRTQEVNRVLSFNLLVRVFSGGVLTQEDEARLLESYPILDAPCRVAIVHTAVPNEEFEQSAVTELLREHLPESFAAATVSRLESGILLPDDADALHELAAILEGVNSQLAVDGLSALCGVSAPFTGAHGVYAAVRQARFSVPIRETSIIEVFSAEESGETRPGVFSWLTHEKLYQAIMNNDEEGTLTFLRGLAADRHAPGDVREVFYGIRFVLRSTARELNLPLPEADSLEYREEMRVKENFRQMEELVRVLFDRMRARKELGAETLSENIVAYVTESFANPDLSATEISNRFALPIKAVYAAVREQTGQSLGDYLTAVRMKEAARLLCTTTDSVDSVAAACGYTAQSTFYRVFKKYYGESPNKYRSLH